MLRRRANPRRALGPGAVLLLAALTCACSQQRPAKVAPETLTIGLRGDIRGTNPGVTRDANTDTVLHHVVEALVAYRDDMSVAPHLAERVEVSADGRTYDFFLRSGVTFHNGSPMTARDVVWSWKRLLDPKTGFQCRSWFDGSYAHGVKVLDVEEIGPLAVRFTLSRPSSTFLYRVADIQCVTAILHPSSVGADGEWIKPIGTGPYEFESWTPGRFVTVRKFHRYQSAPGPRDGYAGRRQALAEKLTFVVVPDQEVGKSGVLAGNLDLFPGISSYATREFSSRSAVKLEGASLMGWAVLLIQTDDALLKDVRLRRAIAHAISASEVALIATDGAAQANASAVPRSSRFHNKSHDRWWAHDLARARRLMREAGYNGQPITIQTNRKYSYMYDNAIVVHSMLKDAGFNVRLEVLDWATQLNNYNKGDFQLSSFGFSSRLHPMTSFLAFVGDKAVEPSTIWDDDAANQLLVDAETRAGSVGDQHYFDQLHARMIDEVPLVGLYNDFAYDLLNPAIEGYAPWAAGRPRLWGVRKVVR